MENIVGNEKNVNVLSLKEVEQKFETIKTFEDFRSNLSGGDDISPYELLRSRRFEETFFGHPVRHVMCEGGGEGGSEYCETVLSIGDGEAKIFIKITYSYYSYQGYDTDYTEVWVVEKKEKTITVYE